MDREEQAREVFSAKLALTGGQLTVAEDIPFVINRPERIDFDVRMPDGSVYVLRNVTCAAFRQASRDEWIAGIRAEREIDPAEALPELPYYYVLSFD